MRHYVKSDKLKSLPLLALCTPAGGRTLDTLIKSQVLYQLSYKRILFGFSDAKLVNYSETCKHYITFFVFLGRKAPKAGRIQYLR